MTLDSITKGLVKAWKTSTGWAITVLVVIILALSLIPGVSLAGLSTFGIFLIALQALEFTKEQSKEWRRKDALLHCYEAEELFKKIKPTIDKLIRTSLDDNKNHQLIFLTRQSIEGYDIETSDHVNRLESSLMMIDSHLKEMGKESIENLLKLLFHIDCNIFLLDIYSHEETEEDQTHIVNILTEIRETAESVGITKNPYSSSTFDEHIHNLKYMVVKK